MGVGQQEDISMSGNGKTRVLHVGKFYPPFMGGMETHLQALCNELQNFVNVRVIVANNSRRDAEEVVSNIPVTRVGKLFDFASAPVCPSMARRIREADSDIIHIHLPNPTAILAYLASGHRGRLVFTYHSDTVRQKVLGKAFDPVQRRALDRSAALIGTSPNYLDSSAVLSAYRDRCHVIPYGIPVEQFYKPDPSAVERIRGRHGERLIISVGRLIYYKGFEYLIRAMAKVDGRLLIIGDGPLRESLQREAHALNLSDKVAFLGEIQNHEIMPYYHAASIFALASVARSEAFGIVQLEAMACGKPVVNTNLASGVPFVSLHGKTGITVPPEDPCALAQAINLLLDNDALRSQYGAEARRRVEQEFSLDKMVSRTLRLYEEVMSAPARSCAPLAPASSVA
jgi:glycosyltransferase involved in cell wall biosynthesis